MAVLYSELEARLQRDGASLAAFCRCTGFSREVLADLRLAEPWPQKWIDRLNLALAAWRDATPEERAAAGSTTYLPLGNTAADAWARSADASTRDYMRRLGGARFADGSAGAVFIDLARVAPAASIAGAPCVRCGAARTCKHRPAAVGAC